MGMIVRSVFNPVSTKMKKCLNVMRSAFTHSAPNAEKSATLTGAEALANQNKMLVTFAKNQIEPLQTEFRSTKELFRYAIGRCVETLKTQGVEHTVVVDMKENKVLAEYIGNDKKCTMANLKSLKIDSENTAVIHGHPENFPLSNPDVNVLLDNEINQIIAVDESGQFSLMAKRAGVPTATLKSQPAREFQYECMDNMDTFYDTNNEELLKELTHYTLATRAESLGLRYVTNYDYLIKRSAL